MKQQSLFQLPHLFQMCREDQHSMFYLMTHDGEMQPVPNVNYTRLVDLGLVVMKPDTVKLTPDGWIVLDAYFEWQHKAGVIPCRRHWKEKK